ncbi:MAG: hypothetical protein GXP39_06935 [Chloroflexi bacterium]|nr:hypothetical protein [Chloroflexota bacterium]
MDVLAEEREEQAISVQLAQDRLRKEVEAAIQAVKSEDWDKAAKHVRDAMAALEGYGYPEPKEQDYGYSPPKSTQENALKDASKAIEAKDKEAAIQALERALPKRREQSLSPGESVVGGPVRVALDAGALEVKPGRTYQAVAIRPGEWKGHGLYASPEVLKRNAHKFNGLASFLNPPMQNPGNHGHPALQLLLGIFDNARWDDEEQAIVGDYHLLSTPAAEWFGRLADELIRLKEQDKPAPDVGLSAVPWVLVGDEREDGLREVMDIVSVEQLDAVFRPAAGGELKRIMAAVGPLGGEREADSGQQIAVSSQQLAVSGEQGARSGGRMEEGMEDREQAQKEEEQQGEKVMTAQKEQQVPGADKQVAARVEAFLAAQREALLSARLAASGLPEAFHENVRRSLPEDWAPADLEAAIESQRQVWAALREDDVVRDLVPNAGIRGMTTSLEQIEEAFLALLEGRRPNDGIRPLSGIRELYTLLSGDYEMRGLFQPENVYLANVTSTTMAGMVANALNKVVVNQFQQYPRWWEPIVRVENFNSLQQIKWITLGGIGELPTVAEGAAYTEMTWDDQTETADWVKKGGYLGITLEAIDKDDTRRLRQAPKALAQAAWLSLGRAIASIFTAGGGVGPTMSDGNALFHAAHNNLGASALSYSAWTATRAAMRKQTELNSGERLGGLVVPKFLLVPPDLEGDALTILMSEGQPGTADNDENPWAQGASHDARLQAATRRVIVVDFWTDANDWAAVADPNLYPTIGLGFRYGQTPEIFSVASPTSGLMFTNDVMPVKVRFFFATGPMDWRGLYKHNVA